MSNAIFYVFMIGTALSALGMLFTKNIFYAAMLLMACLLCIAGLYVFLQAEFLAITQILVYAGGVVVVIIFGIMLTVKSGGKPLAVGNTNILAGCLAGVFFFFLFANAFMQHFGTSLKATHHSAAMHDVGLLLLRDFAI